MKKVVFTLILAILIIIGLFYITEHKVIEENIVDENILENSTNNTENIINTDDIKFDSTKMKSATNYVVYSPMNEDLGNSDLNIEIKDGRAYLSTDVEDEIYKFLFSEETEPIKDKEITGFSSKILDVCFGYMGNGDMAPIILFLMDDGSVEFVISYKMIKMGRFESFGRIEEISNIVKFEQLAANDVNENGEIFGGFTTVVAIDKDGYSYDLSQSKTLQENMQISY